MRTPLLLLPLLLSACSGGPGGMGPDGGGSPDGGAPVDTGPGFECPEPAVAIPARREAAPRGPLDDLLRVHHVQVKGTHNSYHIEPDPAHPAWEYTHAPLDEQLDRQGVRQVELDVWWDLRCERFEAYHVGFLDEVTTCRAFTDCLSAMRRWSDLHPGHPPIFIQIEPKDAVDPEMLEERLTALESEILTIWPREMLITPDEVQGDRATLREAIVMDGWPTLGDARGRALFFMNDGGRHRDAYTADRTTLEGRVMFAEGNDGDPIESVLVLNDPRGDEARIRIAVETGFLVRTRADADGVEARAGDTTRLEAALRSGAHMVSTDFPVPVAGIDYAVEIPGGAPSGCNPVTAPTECTPEAVSLQP